jgi:thiol-disulfide isomerase/thioredoxin
MFRNINNLLTPLIASIFLFFAVSAAAQITSGGGKAAHSTKQIPDIVFTNINGAQKRLSEYRGRVVLLNFWASWCAPCIKEMPELDALQAELGEDKFKVIAISEDGKSPAAADFYTKYNIKNLELFHDAGSKIFFELGLKGLPLSIIIDKNGNEAARIEGYIDWSAGTRLIIDGLIAK